MNGWLTRNEARRKEDLDPLPGLDAPLVPANMLSADQLKALKTPAQPMTQADQKKAAAVIACELLGHPPTPEIEAKVARRTT